MNIGASGSFAAGATSTISVGGALINAGRITSSEDLTVNAGSVTNYGTLGAAQNLNINTSSLLNDRGLIFSGNDMTLSVGNLTNQNFVVISARKHCPTDVPADPANGDLVNSNTLQHQPRP